MYEVQLIRYLQVLSGLLFPFCAFTHFWREALRIYRHSCEIKHVTCCLETDNKMAPLEETL